MRSLAADGIALKAKKPDGSEMQGRYQHKESVKRFISMLRAKLSGRKEQEAGMDEWRRRKLQAQTEREEMRLATERGELHPAALIADLYGKRMIACRDHALAVPTKLAQALEDTTDVSQVFKILTEEMEHLLNTMAAPMADEIAREAHKYATEADPDDPEGDEEPEQEPGADPEA